MSHKKKITFIIIFSIFVFIIGFILTEPVAMGICDSNARFSCIRPLSDIGQPLAMGPISLFLISLILLFFSREVFDAWKKFAVVYIPLAIIWLALTPTSCSSLVCPDREMVTWYTSIGFFLISLGIIIYKKIKISGQSKTVI